ncbi:hypothetical protein [Phocaeicola sp.]
MNNELKVSFYLKREGSTERTEVNPDAVYPIVGKIIIGNSIAQFSSKLKIEERLWSVKSGRAIGKSRVAVELNRGCPKSRTAPSLNSFGEAFYLFSIKHIKSIYI